MSTVLGDARPVVECESVEGQVDLVFAEWEAGLQEVPVSTAPGVEGGGRAANAGWHAFEQQRYRALRVGTAAPEEIDGLVEAQHLSFPSGAWRDAGKLTLLEDRLPTPSVLARAMNQGQSARQVAGTHGRGFISVCRGPAAS